MRRGLIPYPARSHNPPIRFLIFASITDTNSRAADTSARSRSMSATIFCWRKKKPRSGGTLVENNTNQKCECRRHGIEMPRLRRSVRNGRRVATRIPSLRDYCASSFSHRAAITSLISCSFSAISFLNSAIAFCFSSICATSARWTESGGRGMRTSFKVFKLIPA